MEENKFFKWLGRLNSVLFFLLLVLAVCTFSYSLIISNDWSKRNTVEIADDDSPDTEIEDLRLSDISTVCGRDIQYVRLNSAPQTKSGFSSGGYGNVTRNVVFFVGSEMKSSWLFETNSYLIDEIDLLKKTSDDCKDKKTVSIYYEIRKSDTDGDGKLSSNDSLTIALTNPEGMNYTEIETDITSVIDHSIDADASILTVLMQNGRTLTMKKYSLETYEIISKKEITKIRKKL